MTQMFVFSPFFEFAALAISFKITLPIQEEERVALRGS